MQGWLLHAEYAGVESPLLLVVLGLAALGAALLLGLALAAFVRRQSRPYLLIVAAVAALLARSLVAVVAVFAMVSPATHHLAEHAIDVLLVALVVAAVYYARTTVREVETAR